MTRYRSVDGRELQAPPFERIRNEPSNINLGSSFVPAIVDMVSALTRNGATEEQRPSLATQCVMAVIGVKLRAVVTDSPSVTRMIWPPDSYCAMNSAFIQAFTGTFSHANNLYSPGATSLSVKFPLESDWTVLYSNIFCRRDGGGTSTILAEANAFSAASTTEPWILAAFELTDTSICPCKLSTSNPSS